MMKKLGLIILLALAPMLTQAAGGGTGFKMERLKYASMTILQCKTVPRYLSITACLVIVLSTCVITVWRKI